MTSAREVLRPYDAQVRARSSAPWPRGATVVADGTLVRTHYGTHGTVEYVADGRTDPHALVEAQVAFFDERAEPARWNVYSHDPGATGLRAALTDAGFVPGWERPLWVLDVDAWNPARGSDLTPVRIDTSSTAELDDLARASDLAGPHRRPWPECRADGTWRRGRSGAWVDRYVLSDGTVAGYGWARRVPDAVRDPESAFVEICGVTNVSVAAACVEQWAMVDRWKGIPRARVPVSWIVAEADGPLGEELRRCGFRPVTSLRTFERPGTGAGARERPVRELDTYADNEWVRARVQDALGFRPSMDRFPGIGLPVGAMVWDLSRAGDDEDIVDELDALVTGGLRAVVPRGERLTFIDWFHQCYRFDPHLCGGVGRPRWPGSVFPDGDYTKYVTDDLRLGIFGHPWEGTLSLWGGGLVERLSSGLTDLLGEPVRGCLGNQGVP